MSQTEEIYRKSGATEDEIKAVLDWHKKAHNIVKNTSDSVKLQAALATLIKEFDSWSEERKARLGVSDASKQMLQTFFSSQWMKHFLSYDPKPILKQVKVPVLAINGSKDVQVLADLNLKAIEEGLKSGGNRKYEVKKLEGLNHLFQQAATGLMAEYGQIEQTIDPSVLDLIANWISKTIK